MRKSFKKLMAAGLAAVMVLSLAACGGSSDNQAAESDKAQAEETTGGAGNAAAQAAASGETEAVVVEHPEQPEGWTEKDATETVIYQTGAAISTLDKWAKSTESTNFEINYLVFDGLLAKDDEGNTIPWLAEEYEMSEDYSSISFKLRDGVYFTNGEKLTADDVVFTLERLRDDKEHLPDSTVKSWRNYIGEVEKVDDRNLVLNFTQVMPEFWTLVNVPDIMVVNKKAYEEMGYDEFWQHPVGTGAYVVSDFDGANSSVDLEIRTDENGYWGYDYTNTYTNVKYIKFRQSKEATTRVSSLRTGEANVIANPPTTDAESLRGEGFDIFEIPPATYVFLQFACAEGDTFDNKDLREALSLCIDRPLIVQALLDGYGIPVDYPCLSYQLGYRDDIKYEYDKEKAAELVKNSGYDGKELKFIYSASLAGGTELSQAIQSMAAEVGINLQVTPLETAIYDEARNNHDYDLCIASIGSSITMWYKTAAEVIGNDRFNTGLHNEEMMALGHQIGTEMDETKQDEILSELYKMELTEFEPNLYLYWPINLQAWDSKIKGISFRGHKIMDMRFMVYGK